MLKFIPQNENDYEKSAKEELGITSNFLDFLSQEPQTISEKINSTLPEIKSSKKGELLYNKIIYLFSLLLNTDSLKDEEKIKKVIKNLIEICEPITGIKIYQDLFYMLTEGNNYLPLKKEILNQIQKSDLNFEENDFIILYNLFINYLLDKNFDNDIFSIFADILEKNKHYILLNKLENTEKIKIIIQEEYIKNKHLVIKNISLSKLFFYLIITSQDLVDQNLEDLELNEKLIEEKNMFNNLENRKDEKILFNYDNQKYFEETYGEKAADLILIGAKEVCIHEILTGFDDDEKQRTISFKQFIQRIYEDDEEDESKKVEFKDEEIKSKFEEIEDMIISGKEHKLYNIVIDYSKQEIRVLYLRRPEYTKEQRDEVLNKVKEMKSKLEGILRAIEKI